MNTIYYAKSLLGVDEIDPKWQSIPGMQYIMESGEKPGEGIKIKISVDNKRLIAFSPEYIISQILDYLKTEINTAVTDPASVVINVLVGTFYSSVDSISLEPKAI